MQYGHFQNGVYQVGIREIYFRSGWEYKYALYLEWLKTQGKIKDWNYECKIFVFDKIKHGTTRYIPDFEIENLDSSKEYHEVKGFMDSRSKTKLKRMAKYYSKVKLIVIDKEWFKANKKWEKLWS